MPLRADRLEIISSGKIFECCVCNFKGNIIL